MKMIDKKIYNEARDFRNKSGFCTILCWILFGILYHSPDSDVIIVGIVAVILTIMFFVFYTIVYYYKNINKNNRYE